MRNVEKLIIMMLLIAAVVIPACTQKEVAPEAKQEKAQSAPVAVAAKTVKTPSGLEYQDLVVGTGAPAEPGKPVKVHYTGWLTNGTKFDSSVDRGQPFVFTLGAGVVIPGW